MYCFSEERAAKERGIAERIARRFESDTDKSGERATAVRAAAQ